LVPGASISSGNIFAGRGLGVSSGRPLDCGYRAVPVGHQGRLLLLPGVVGEIRPMRPTGETGLGDVFWITRGVLRAEQG